MKKMLFTLLVAATTSTMFAQRMSLVEEFTGANCGPCASTNPAFNTLLDANTSNVIKLKYMAPIPSADAILYANNSTEIDARISYYGCNYAPWANEDGQVPTTAASNPNHPANITQTSLNSFTSIAAPVNITMTHSIIGNYDSIKVTCTITAVTAVPTGNYFLRIAVAEKNVQFKSAPGSNGETDFSNIMKKMLPSTSGYALPATMNAGDVITYSTSWKLPSLTTGTTPTNYFYNKAQIFAIAWMQNDADKKILNAAQTTPTTPASDVAIDNVNVQSISCGTFSNPVVVIKNTGTTTLTSAEIKWKVDATGTYATYSWTGSLAPNATANATINVGTVATGSHSFIAEISKINGVAPLVVAMNQTTKSPFEIYSFTSYPSTATFTTVPVLEGFEGSTTNIPTNWALPTLADKSMWKYANTATGSNGATTRTYGADFYTVAAGEVGNFIMGTYNTTTSATNLYYDFDVAYKQYSTENDKLELVSSQDCGTTWTSNWNQSGSALTNSAASTSGYVPAAASDWKHFRVDISSLKNKSNIMFAFKATSAYGNRCFIDNINLNTTPTATSTIIENSISVFPNPATSELNIVGINGEVSFSFTDVLGRTIKTINMSNIENGVKLNVSDLAVGTYVLKISIDGKTSTKKVVISE